MTKKNISHYSGLPIKVLVLAPYLVTQDENINYYYDFSQSIAEYTAVFAALKIAWQWQPVTINDYAAIIDIIVSEKKMGEYFPVVLNICDGDEVNGTPGISIVNLLEENGLVYTGSDAYFYNITTSKIPMKRSFDKAAVPTAKWEAIHEPTQDLNGIFSRIGCPVILKPSVSGGSMGVGTQNVVYNYEALQEQVNKMFAGYRGWNLVTDGLIAEAFITGEEYTTLIVGDYNNPASATIYNPVERVFHPSLPDAEKFLSFDRLWEIYEEETPMPNQENFYEYAAPVAILNDEIKRISWQAYVATRGTGYSRVDVRRDTATGNLFVLEVNAQCGISEDEDYTSIGAILKLNGKSFTQLVTEIINHAFARNKVIVVEKIATKKIA